MEASLVGHKVSWEARAAGVTWKVGTDLEAKEVWEVGEVGEDREVGADFETKEVGEVHFSLEVGEDQQNLQASLVVHKTNWEAMEVKGVSSGVAWVISREQEECSEEEALKADPSLDLEPQAVWRACPLLEPGVHLAL